MEEQVELFKTNITPAQGRILCQPFMADNERKTDSGIILLPGMRVNEKTKEKVNPYRYVVVAVGKLNDQVHIRNEDGTFREIRRGDEVVWYIPEAAVGVDHALVTDWETGEEMVMFHETELAGALECLPEDA